MHDDLMMFSLADNFDKYDAGLLSFIARGEGEEWRLVEVPDGLGHQWSPAPGHSSTLSTSQRRIFNKFPPETGWIHPQKAFVLMRACTLSLPSLLSSNNYNYLNLGSHTNPTKVCDVEYWTVPQAGRLSTSPWRT